MNPRKCAKFLRYQEKSKNLKKLNFGEWNFITHEVEHPCLQFEVKKGCRKYLFM